MVYRCVIVVGSNNGAHESNEDRAGTLM